MQIKSVQFLWKLLQRQERTLRIYLLRLVSIIILQDKKKGELLRNS